MLYSPAYLSDLEAASLPCAALTAWSAIVTHDTLGPGSKVLVHTDLTLSGSVAQYGRGVGMIQATASALMNQFANNLKKQLANPIAETAAETGNAAMPPAAKPISATSLAGQVVWNSIKGKLGGKSEE